MDVDKLIDEIKALPKEDVHKIEAALKKAEDGKALSKLKATVESHKSYVGKCYRRRVQPDNGMFPEMWRYMKVLSERSSNEYRMETLIFDEHPVYWFEHKSSKMDRIGYNYLGEFDFEGLRVEDYPFFCYTPRTGGKQMEIDLLEEIAPGEYNRAMNQYIMELQELVWYPDHWRFGGKLPSDPKWPAEQVKL